MNTALVPYEASRKDDRDHAADGAQGVEPTNEAPGRNLVPYVGSPLPLLPAPGHDAEVRQDADTEDPWLDELGAIWSATFPNEVAKYLRVGTHLSWKLGPAYKKKMKPGAGEWLRRASLRLGVPKKELRWAHRFADRFGRFERFNKMHPTVDTWEAVKRLFPQIKGHQGYGRRSAQNIAKAKEAACQKGLIALETSIGELYMAGPVPPGRLADQLRAGIKSLNEVAIANLPGAKGSAV